MSISKRRFHLLFVKSFIFALTILCLSCTSARDIPEEEKEEPAQEKTAVSPKQESSITLFFAGDIMAHSVNYKNTNFKRIWRDIKPLLDTGDLAFANIEAPVANNIAWSTYPQFNMHSEYVEAAIGAGFNVFSLANNHTNDQYLDGIRQTKKYFDGRSEIWACGLKEKSGGPLSYQLVEKNGWKILFVAITELLNRPDFASYIDYYPSTQKKRAILKEELKSLRTANDCDIFVLSVHTDEPEYIQTITESRRAFYRELVEECGIDVIWANHPHVSKRWETIFAENSPKEPKAFVMYANGNTISGQRTSPSFTVTETERDLTGDGIIFKLVFKKSEGKKAVLSQTKPFFITTYISPSWQFVVKLLDDDFIHALDRADLTSWSEYLKKRKASLEKFTDISETQSVQK